jgi:oligoendopeptidase F
MTKLRTEWNLGLLFASENDPEIGKTRKEVEEVTRAFVKKWKETDSYLKEPEKLKEALDEYESWLRNFGAGAKENYYFELKSSLDQNDPKIKARLNQITEFAQKIQTEMQFFELRVAKIDPKSQKKFLDYKPLAPYRHFLERVFESAKHLLSESEEKIMVLKSPTSHANWVKMTQGFLTKEERKVLDEDEKPALKNFSEILSLINNKNKKVRDTAAKAFNEILDKNLDVAENELNSVLQNKKIDDDLRHFARPDAERHFNDDIDAQTVDTLVKTVSEHFDISERYYALKAKLFGIKKLEYHERGVEYGSIDKKYILNDGINLVKNVFRNLDLEFLTIFEDFLIRGKIDVYPKKGKTSGGFCTQPSLINPTYILVNWTDKISDVSTLAHEMGHGINNELMRKVQNAINFEVPMATAEVASTFMEDFIQQIMLKSANDEFKLSLMVSKLNEDVSAIFRQVAFYNFELELHNKFREVGYLSKDEIGKLFQKHMASYMGKAVEQSDGSQNWWVYWQHLRYFFYVYSYASGLLISKSLQASVKKDPKFIFKVKEFLSAGLSDSPKNIFAKLGIDITDKNFWIQGIKEVEDLLSETEKLAKKLKKI